VAVDDEGGRITALADAAPSARDQARTMTPDGIRQLAHDRGEAMRRAGVNLDFAPVVDLSDGDASNAIGDRSYGTDPEQVTRDAGAFAAGLRDAGVLPTLKHFPGHGRASGDSHQAVVSTPPLQRLQRTDLAPYAALVERGEVAVMVGHLDVPGLTETGVPASLSPAAYRYLRSRIHFEGLAVTDELGAMAAVTSRYTTPEAAVTAIAAGADVALLGPTDAYGSVVDALDQALTAGSLSQDRVDEALGRVRRAQGCGG
jgi:beta-N-acetylhexosaminidase